MWDGRERLGLSAPAWEGAKVAPKVHTVFVADRTGVIRFEYTSQNTFDRPSASDLVEVSNGWPTGQGRPLGRPEPAVGLEPTAG